MCLGLPGQVVSIVGSSATIECWGTRKRVRIDESVEDTIRTGDYVIEHDGVVVRRIPPENVEDTLALYETILAETLIPA
jgi:hydrogenase expression/formation protein HypC